MSLLVLSVSAIPGPAPDVSGAEAFHFSSDAVSGDNTTPVLQPEGKSQSMTVSAQDVTKSSSSQATVTQAEEDTQASNINWQKCYGGSGEDVAFSLIKTEDGGYFFCGYANSTDANISGFHGYYDYWAVKFDATGSVEWQKCLGGSDADIGMSVNQTADNGYLITGYAYSTDGDVIANHGADDSWTVKLSANGTTEWSDSLGGSKYDWGWSGIQTDDNGYLIAGGAGSEDGNVSENHGYYDAWIQKLNNNGTLQWEKCLGGTKFDEANSVLQTPDGGYIVAGQTSSTDGDVSGNQGYYDAWIVGLDATGGIEWQKCFGGTGDDQANSMIRTEDGGYLIGGYTNSTDGNVSGNHGDYDAWILKLDADGNLIWQQCLGGTGDDGAQFVTLDSDGGYLVAGYTDSDDGDVSGNHGDYDAWILKLDTDGNLIWQQCLGGTGDDDAASLVQIADERYMVAGYTSSNDGDVSGNHGDYDAWVVDLTSESATETEIETVDMQTLLSQPGPNGGGTSTLGTVDNWFFDTLSTEASAESEQGSSDSMKVVFTANETNGSAPLTVAFTSACEGDPISYYWNFGDGATSGEKDPVHTYTVPGTYSVTLKIMNETSGAFGVHPNAITVTDSRIFAKKYQAPGTV